MQSSSSSLFLRLWVALLLAFALLLPGMTQADDSLARVRQQGVLRVAVDPTYPPMEFTAPGGKLAGFDIDLAEEIARRLGVRVLFREQPFDAIFAGLDARKGDYDAIISSLNVTAERKNRLAFVEYLQAAQVFVVRKGTAFTGETDLRGKVVAVAADSTSAAWVTQRGAALGIREVKQFVDGNLVFMAVEAGDAEIIVVDEPVGRYYVRRNPALFVLAGVALDPEPIGVAVRNEDASLHAAIGDAVELMRRDGTLTRLEQKWFAEVPQELSFLGYSWGVVIPRMLLGMWLTVRLTVAAGSLGIALGFLVALARRSRWAILRLAALGYVTLFRGTPLLLQVLFFYFALPPLLNLHLEAITAGILALAMNMAAYSAEVFRAGIESVDPGQTETARALGLSRWQALWYVVLPQAYRRLVAPLVNDLAALSKDTSLVSVLSLHEMLFVTQRLAAAHLRPWEVYAWAALGYLIIVLALTAAADWLESRLERGQS